MVRKQKRFDKEKKQFSSYYCLDCKQRKSCGQLDDQKRYCCPCYSQEILAELEKDGLLISSAQQALDNYRSGVIVCQCLEAEKLRAKYIHYDGSGWIKCESEKCKKIITSAGHHGVIKNRNDPKFWGLEVKEKVLCGGCLANYQEKMPKRKQYLFREYQKRGSWK